MSDTRAIQDTEKHGRRYADETRELAFQLYEMRCQKSCAKVSRLLASEEFGNLDISARTIQRWADEDGWELEAVRRFDAAFPGFHHWLFRSMVYAAAEGVPYWQDVNAGRVEKPDKVRMQAITAAFDRVGFSPIGKGTPQPMNPGDTEHAVTAGDLVGLSPDELMRRELQAKERKR